jgi:hypothetical protein
VVWSAAERRKLESRQTDFGRWLWRIDSVERCVRNVVVKGETVRSSFADREAKARAVYVNRVLDGGFSGMSGSWSGFSNQA